MHYFSPLPSASVLRRRRYKLDSTHPKEAGSGLCREKTSRNGAAPSGPLWFCAAATSMAIAAGRLSLVERDSLGFLRQENKAQWRKVSLHWPSPASSPSDRGGVPRASSGKERGSLPGRCSCASPGVSAAQNLQSLQRHRNERPVALGLGGLGKPEDSSHLPRGTFPRVGSLTLSRRRTLGRCKSGVGCAACHVGGVPERLAMHHSTREEFNTDSGVQQKSVRTTNRSE